MIPLHVLRSTASTVSVSGLPDVASRPVRRCFLEPKRQGEVGSFRRRGEVWRLVGVHVLTRLEGSLKTGSQLWVNLLELG